MNTSDYNSEQQLDPWNQDLQLGMNENTYVSNQDMVDLRQLTRELDPRNHDVLVEMNDNTHVSKQDVGDLSQSIRYGLNIEEVVTNQPLVKRDGVISLENMCVGSRGLLNKDDQDATKVKIIAIGEAILCPELDDSFMESEFDNLDEEHPLMESEFDNLDDVHPLIHFQNYICPDLEGILTPFKDSGIVSNEFDNTQNKDPWLQQHKESKFLNFQPLCK